MVMGWLTAGVSRCMTRKRAWHGYKGACGVGMGRVRAMATCMHWRYFVETFRSCTRMPLLRDTCAMGGDQGA